MTDLPAVPQRRLRLAVALLCGVGLGIATYFLSTPTRPTDWDELHEAARAWLAGQDPYDAMRDAWVFVQFKYPLVYPGAAVLLVTPFALLPLPVALALWVGLGSAALAWAITRHTWWGLLVFGSASFLHAFVYAQWSPLLAGAIALPWLGFAWIAKPTIGPALFAAFPSWPAAIGCLLLLIASLVAIPDWPYQMRSMVATVPHVIPLVFRPGGVLLLLGWLRWRTAEGRLLGALAVMPQTPILYETLPLFLIPRTFREFAVLAVLSLAVPHLVTIPGYSAFAVRMTRDWPWLFFLLYLPCLIMVLRRPNVSAAELQRAGATEATQAL